MPSDKGPNDFRERIGNILADTIGVCDGMDQLAAQIYELVDGQHQALLDILEYKVPAGADLREAITGIKKLALLGLGKDATGNVIPIFGKYPEAE